MPSAVIVEGDVDQAIVKATAATLYVPRPERPLGREAAIHRAGIAIKQVGVHRLALLLDRNRKTPHQIESEVRAIFNQQWGIVPAREGPWYVRENSAVRLVFAGLPDDPLIKSLDVKSFTSDDYLLKLLLTDDSLHQFCASEKNLAYIPADASRLRQLIKEQAVTLATRHIVIDSSKRYVQLARAILRFDASRATLAEHLITRAPEYMREEVLGQLRNELINDPPLEMQR